MQKDHQAKDLIYLIAASGSVIALLITAYNYLGLGISKDCNELANKVVSSSASQAAREGGSLTSFSNLREVSKGDNQIVCQGYFEGNGVYRSDTYTISEDNSGVYWRTPGRIEFSQEIQIPQQQQSDNPWEYHGF